MLRSASCEGAQVPLAFCRQRSLSEALMETTTVRLSGFSGAATANELPSPRASPEAMEASWNSIIGMAGALAFSARTDIWVDEL